MAKNRYLAAGLACTLACALTQQVCAEPVPSAYQLIAAAHQIPPTVLYAVATQESNRRQKSGRYRPWPWTLNVAGKSYYYNSRQTACTALHIALKAHNAKNIDVASSNQCLDGLNAFRTPCDGLDPYANLERRCKAFANPLQQFRELGDSHGSVSLPSRRSNRCTLSKLSTAPPSSHKPKTLT